MYTLITKKMEFKAAFVKQANMTTTENGAVALPETGSKVLDLFSSITRDSDTETLIKSLENAWEESPLYTLKCMFAKRDIRGEAGQGERRLFTTFYTWLFTNHPQVAYKNIVHISEYGYWKDLLNIAHGDDTILDEVYRVFGEQLMKDLVDMCDGKPTSLAAKWIPSVNSKQAKHDNMPQRLKKSMSLQTNTPSQYLRKNVITPLRKHINIVEKKMCDKNWGDIDYSTVPSIAMKKYRHAFTRNDEDRFNEFMESVRQGTAKINTQTLSPVDLVSAYSKKGWDCEVDEVLELQWSEMIKKGIEELKQDLSESKILPVCDVSGSMNGTPMNVSIGLGAYIAKVNRGFFKNLIVSFSDEPRMMNMDGVDNLRDIINTMQKSEYVGYNTDLMKTFKVILEMATENNIKADQMPEKLLLISDMEFDQAQDVNGTGNSVNLKVVREMYKKAGYEMPQIIFWNVRTTGTAPCESRDDGVLYIGGYSKNIVSMLMKNEFPNPLALLYSVLDSSRYDVIKV